MNIDYKRSLGVLLHITSLYSPYGIGDLGPEARKFASRLAETGATYWQLLPLGPTGYGNSPYSARSAFAGNELFLSPDILFEQGFLTKEELASAPSFPEGRVDFDAVHAWKTPLLTKAASRFLEKNGKSRAYIAFKKENGYWLEDYALYMVLYSKYRDSRWYLWDEKEKNRDPKTLAALKKNKRQNIEIIFALQYLFYEEWTALRSYVNKLGLKLIGDVPIFAGGDSADTWSHLEIFKTDENGAYSAVSGVPPDGFAPEGQLWGTPVYDWKVLKETGYDWWLKRISHLFSLTDVLRIDHFKGMDAYFEIDAKATTAADGKWVKAPGADFFKTVKTTLGKLPIIAEDLGYLTPSVVKLRKSNGFPGMKISQFGFTQKENGDFNADDDFLPHNYERDYVAYTGTHDNDTVRGWFDSLSPLARHQVREYLASPDEEIVWSLIRAVMLSHADTAIFPMQDLLELGADARMNTPGTCNNINWSWRMKKDQFSEYAKNRFAFLARISGRAR
jgi:4-alpha-glucanotransferase